MYANERLETRQEELTDWQDAMKKTAAPGTRRRQGAATRRGLIRDGVAAGALPFALVIPSLARGAVTQKDRLRQLHEREVEFIEGVNRRLAQARPTPTPPPPLPRSPQTETYCIKITYTATTTPDEKGGHYDGEDKNETRVKD